MLLTACYCMRLSTHFSWHEDRLCWRSAWTSGCSFQIVTLSGWGFQVVAFADGTPQIVIVSPAVQQPAAVYHMG